MEETHTVRNCEVECLEISISKKAIERHGHNLLWTLSVYSLDNQPLQCSAEKTDTLHFRIMVYDWNRTIRELLDEHQIPYSFSENFPLEILNQPKRKIQGTERDSGIPFRAYYHTTPDAQFKEQTLWASMPVV